MLIQKKSIVYSKVLLALIIILLLMGALDVFRLVYAGTQSSKNFSIYENVDTFDDSSYYLSINEKDFYGMNLEKIQTSMETSLPNYKVTYMLDMIVSIIRQAVFIGIFFIVYKMLNEINEEGSAFIISNTKRLRIISALILVLVFIPAMLGLFVNFFIFSNASATYTFNDIMLILISLAIWGISYVMDYGCELQKEVDQTL